MTRPVTPPTFPVERSIARCKGCGHYRFRELPCPVCDTAARARHSSHDWEDVEGTPTCLGCSAKIWHRAAFDYCPEAVTP